jgi:hypothetical protein
MPKEIMRRRAADNPYLHKDFHGALSCGIQYLHDRYGAESVRDYLRQFTDAWHAPLKAALRERGLAAVAEYVTRIYETEGADFAVEGGGEELVLRVAACPAVMHMREHGYPVADLWIETTRTVYDRLCEGTPFAFELVEYEEATGRSVQRFSRRAT